MHPHKSAHQPTAKSSIKPLNEQELTKDYWMNNAKAFVEQQIKLQPNTNKARNVIMFLGDGMSHFTVGLYFHGKKIF
jgi:alkaline phosphatase